MQSSLGQSVERTYLPHMHISVLEVRTSQMLESFGLGLTDTPARCDDALATVIGREDSEYPVQRASHREG